jgi:hypothetical protein
MVQRRNLQSTMDGYDDDDGGDGDIGGGLPMVGGAGTGKFDEFGNELPDFSNDPNFPTPFQDYVPDEIAGDSQSAREIGRGGKPTTPLQGQGLPRGVSVEELTTPSSYRANETPSSYVAPTEDAPGMSMFPDPVTLGDPAPQTKMTSGPTRRTVTNAPSAIFQESGGGRMFGDAGGLMGGGRGAVGTNAGGPTATEMMLSILRSLRGGV